VAWARVERDWVARLCFTLVGLGCAVGVFALSYANGGFDGTVKAYAGISAWWILGIGAVIWIGVRRLGVSRIAVWALGLFAAFAIWTLISMQWAPDNERAFAQFDQVSLYVAVFALAIVIARLVPAWIIVSGVALALTAVAAVALVSRLFPSSFGLQLSTVLPSLNKRLSFPLGYWNGLGIEVALAYPLLLAIMASRRSRVAAGLAVLPLPILAADMYLTSSRGAFVAAGVAVVAYVVLSPNRWASVAAAVVAGGAGAVAVATLAPRHELVNGLTGTPLGNAQAHHAALVIGIACVGAGAVWAGLSELGRRMPAPPRVAGWAVAGLAAAVVLVGIVASHPIARFDTFKNNSGGVGNGSQAFVTQHLLTTSGSGRWQFWSAAISQFRAYPVLGGGAGSWAAWWLQHGTLPSFFTQYAHSLYLESLAELGIIGLLLIGGAIVVAVVGAVRSAFTSRSSEIAGAAAAGIAFFAAAAYDWVWQLAGLAVVGLGMLGVALGAGGGPSVSVRRWERLGVLRTLVALVAVAAILAQVVVLVAGLHIRNSQQALAAGNATRARAEALAARVVEPWAAGPYLQLALIDQNVRNYARAHAEIRAALRRSHRDWQIWLIAARIDTLYGRIAAARLEYHEAKGLNPNGPIFQSGR
jgi:hypothetical protein